MVEITDIVDEVSLEAWLKQQPQEVSVWIAHRGAMRLLPQWWEWSPRQTGATKADLTTLPVLRANLISGVVRKMRTPEIKRADDAMDEARAARLVRADDAKDTARTAGHRRIVYPDDASRATYAALTTYEANAANAAHKADAAYVARTSKADYATYAASSSIIASRTACADARAFVDIWQLVRIDCEAITRDSDLDRLPLWGGLENPLADVWAEIKKQLPTASPSRSDESAHGAPDVDWSFWIKWYDDALNGTPPNWKMLERIALIDPEDWDKGAEVVNPLIAEIQLQYELKEQIAAFEAKLHSTSTEMRGMGDNQGPPMGATVANELLVVWAPLQELMQEVENETPDKSRVLEIAKKLYALSITIAKWAAGKVDKAVNAFVVAVGGGAGGVSIAWYAQEANTVTGMLSKIAEIAGKWAEYLQ